MKLVYWMINLLLLAFVVKDYFSDPSGNKSPLFSYVVTFVVINLSVLAVQFLTIRLSDKAISWIDKKKMDNYSLYEWSGEIVWLKFHEQLLGIRDFNPKDLSGNYGRIKEEMKTTFTTREDLYAFKIHLEVTCESPRLNSLLDTTRTILIPMITLSLVALIDFRELTQQKMIFYTILFTSVWFCLLIVIDRVSKKIDRNKLLLKLVKECLEGNDSKGK